MAWIWITASQLTTTTTNAKPCWGKFCRRKCRRKSHSMTRLSIDAKVIPSTVEHRYNALFYEEFWWIGRLNFGLYKLFFCRANLYGKKLTRPIICAIGGAIAISPSLVIFLISQKSTGLRDEFFSPVKKTDQSKQFTQSLKIQRQIKCFCGPTNIQIFAWFCHLWATSHLSFPGLSWAFSWGDLISLELFQERGKKGLSYSYWAGGQFTLDD